MVGDRSREAWVRNYQEGRSGEANRFPQRSNFDVLVVIERLGALKQMTPPRMTSLLVANGKSEYTMGVFSLDRIDTYISVLVLEKAEAHLSQMFYILLVPYRKMLVSKAVIYFSRRIWLGMRAPTLQAQDLCCKREDLRKYRAADVLQIRNANLQ